VIKRIVCEGSKNMKGIILAKYEDGTEKLLPKATYLRMIKAGRKFKLLKEIQHWNDLQ
jgi:hypothetical protein